MAGNWRIEIDNIEPIWVLCFHDCTALGSRALYYSKTRLHRLWEPKSCACGEVLPEAILIQARLLLEIRCGK